MRGVRWCVLGALVSVLREAYGESASQPLEGPVDRSTENGLLASQPCRAVRI